MERFVVEWAVRTILIAIAAGAVLSVARIRAAAVRHSIWSGVLFVMLLLPIWQATGLHVSWRVLPPLPSAARVSVMVPPQMTSIDVQRGTVAAAPVTGREATWPRTFSIWLTVVYLLGTTTLLSRLLVGTMR